MCPLNHLYSTFSLFFTYSTVTIFLLQEPSVPRLPHLRSSTLYHSSSTSSSFFTADHSLSHSSSHYLLHHSPSTRAPPSLTSQPTSGGPASSFTTTSSSSSSSSWGHAGNVLALYLLQQHLLFTHLLPFPVLLMLNVAWFDCFFFRSRIKTWTWTQTRSRSSTWFQLPAAVSGCV